MSKGTPQNVFQLIEEENFALERVITKILLDKNNNNTLCGKIYLINIHTYILITSK